MRPMQNLSVMAWVRDALEKLQSALDGSRTMGYASLVIRFDPARPTGGETLFQPVGRALAAEKEKGIISHCHPLVEDSSVGFYVVFKGQ